MKRALVIVAVLALAALSLAAFARPTHRVTWCHAHHVTVLRGMACEQVRWILADPLRNGS